ncbi:hypothetical protein J7M28_07565 [bacterium]|nr:hypothetical protein [bacterium]
MNRTDCSLSTEIDPVVSSFPSKHSLEAQIGRFFASHPLGHPQPSGHNTLIYALALANNRQQFALNRKPDLWAEKDVRKYFSSGDKRVGALDWPMPGETGAVHKCGSLHEEQLMRDHAAVEEKPKRHRLPPVSEDKSIQAYKRLLPALLRDHESEFVAFAEGELIGTNPDREELRKLARCLHPGKSILITRIQKQRRAVRILSPRRGLSRASA